MKSIIWVPVLLQLNAGLAICQPSQVHLSWNGSDMKTTASSIAVTWSSERDGSSFIKYGSTGGNVKLQKSTTFFSESLNQYVSKVTVKGLRPNTQYWYICGSKTLGWSDTFHFQTAPFMGASQKFVVGVWGDTQDNGTNLEFERSSEIVALMQKHPIQFSIHMGDIVENGWIAKSWKGLLTAAQPINANAPFMPVTGNHDVDNEESSKIFQSPFPVFFDLFSLPSRSSNYSFTYGNTQFIAINSGFAKEAEKSQKVLFNAGSPEYHWLDRQLKMARSNQKIQWIIIYMHYPLYSFGWSHVPQWQANIVPLLDKYEVDLALSGHRHVYERHAAIRDNKVIKPATNNHYHQPNGTIYITNGSSGGSPQGTGGWELPTMIFSPDVKMYNYAIMTIEGKFIKYEVYNQHDQQIDSFTISK